MYDGTSPSDRPGEIIPLQRARGWARIAVRAEGGVTRLAELYQDGCAKLRLPKVYGPSSVEAVLLNTAGGLTGGDVYGTEAEAGPGAALTLTTQACERVYRATGDQPARVETRLAAGPGATLHWLPQETILFDGGRLDRSLDVDLDGDAAFLAVEALVLGRVASGEIVTGGTFTDSWRVRRDGKLIFADAARIAGDIDNVAVGPAVLAGNKAMATVVLAVARAEEKLAEARAVLDPLATAGASALPGLLICRLVAPDDRALRARLVPLLNLLAGRALPRVWHL
ncbi:urease accessory protein UreD [Thalassospiraceae bacterium LMO-SO8]|nr:urease accessory protein UreD [Alphaproteobacteria bacterium LMO-S08]WND76692.1 urease accessory protein UreD [Thalassospiraceae bacterium LMO-SO8]